MRPGHEILAPFTLPDAMREQIAVEIDKELKKRRSLGRREAFKIVSQNAEMQIYVEEQEYRL